MIKDILENIELEEMPEPEPTEFEKTIQNITNIQNEWNKPQEQVEVPKLTKEEIRQYEIQNQISELKGKLIETDYQAIKYAEGQISETDYAPIKAQRQEWRNKINQLEKEI